MNNFYFYVPTKIIFGQKMVENISKEIPQNSKLLILYGTGSIKRYGIYDDVLKAINDYEYYEFGGIEPNPDYEVCLSAIEYVKNKNIDFLLAVGGGSVIDATKFIALASRSNLENPWNFMLGDRYFHLDSLPFGCIQTVPASGTEMNNAFVISNRKRKEKMVGSSFLTYPKFSILDPTYLFSLSNSQLINSIIDIYVHVVEQYITYIHGSLLHDYQAEAFLKALIEIAPKILKNKTYEHLSNLLWLSSQVSSGILSRGVPVDWSTHSIGHQITVETGLDHAKTLAIILFGVWEFELKRKEEKLSLYARHVWGIEKSQKENALFAIEKTESFFRELGMKTRFSEYDIDAQVLASKVAEYFHIKKIKIGEYKDIDHEKIEKIIKGRQ